MQLNIRKANKSDSPSIRTLVFSVLEEYGLEPDPEGTDNDLKDIEASYFSKGGYFAVAEHQGEIIASLGILPVSSSVCELRKMYCSKNHRGKGLGRKLLEHAIEQAKKTGYSEMVLETASVLKEAVGLYKKYGFVSYTPEHMVFRCDQAYRLKL